MRKCAVLSGRCNLGSTSSMSTQQLLAPLENHDTTTLSSQLHTKGFAKTIYPILTTQTCQRVKEQMPKLFRGEFETGVYPDEWHWRQGISLPNAAREMCNTWKSDRTIASIVLNEEMGRFIAQIMGWEEYGVRIAQDDLIWKVPSTAKLHDSWRIDTVGFHQDSAYISSQFDPYENNSVTLWMALDDADEDTGCVEYAAGSHKWSPLLHKREKVEEEDQNEEGTESSIHNEMSSFHSSDETSYRNGLTLAASLARVSNPMDTIEPVPVKEGCAILHHQDIWHGSGPNLSNTRHRRALVVHYIRGDVKFRGSTTCDTSGPFGNATYIYGRYKRYNSVDLDESFFPIIYSNRTAWIDDYLRP